MNRMQRSVLRGIIVPSILFGLIGAGLTLLVERQLVYLTIGAGFCFGFLSILGIMTIELLIKPRSFSRLSLGLEILFSAILEAAYVVAVFETSLSAFRTMLTGSALAALIQTLDLPMAATILGGAALILQFILGTTKLVGSRNLWRFLVGLYRNPREMEQFAVSISLANQQKITDLYGQRGYLDFLNAFYADVEKAAFHCGGEIYRHVESGAILHWRAFPGEANNACIAFVFRLRQLVSARETWYQSNFHQSPDFRASVHFGTIFTNEAGWNRKELLRSGTVLNTLAKLDHACGRMHETFLVSDTAMDHMVLPAGTRIHRTIHARLRDEDQAWRIYALEQIPV